MKSKKFSLLFFTTFFALILAELLKGLSANGTPPILQDYDWQLDLAYFMWSNILYIRIILGALLIYLLWKMSTNKRLSIFTIISSVLLLGLWIAIYWFFNHHYNGASKFHLLKNPNFVSATENKIPNSLQVIGLDINGKQKAYPLNMMVYHHQIPDVLGDQSIWLTYCGLCRSGRVYDKVVDGTDLDFEIVGAITYNAVFKDIQTGSWWQQETGEAVKGKLKGQVMKDFPMEQMSLENWLALHPNSQILQYEPKFQEKYNFIEKVFLNDEKGPEWRGHERPAVIVGVTIDGNTKAYDWEALQSQRMVLDQIGNNHVMVLSSADGSSPFVYNRLVNGNVLDFEISGDTMKDLTKQSTWNIFGQCTEGELAGTQLEKIQLYQQNIRSWKEFHPESTYYKF